MIAARKDFVQMLFRKTGCTKEEANRMTDAIFIIIRDTLASGHEVRIYGFGRFYVKTFQPKSNAYIPATGERRYMPSKPMVRFIPSSVMAQMIDPPKFIPPSTDPPKFIPPST